jgi:ABC-2 type transport system ATP-binding protein
MQYALELKNVTKHYYTRHSVKTAVTDLSFAIKKGTVFGFLGPNGAGKTTTMKMIVGLIQVDKGAIRIFDHIAGSLAAKRAMGYLPENPVFYRYLTGLEFVTMHGELMGLARNQAQDEAQAMLKKVGLEKSSKRPIREYSKGMVQRAGLAQALIGNPDILFLDEPLDGLDAFGRAEIKEVIHDLKKQHKTIFFNSHILSDVQEICDDIGIIDRGVLLEVGAIKTLVKNQHSLEEHFVKLINKSRDEA